MRLAISRKPVFEAQAGSDVEIEITDPALIEALSDPEIMPVEVRCSMSNEVKRRFPVPSFRAADYPGVAKLDVSVKISSGGIEASAAGESVRMDLPSVQKANRPELTEGAVRKCFGKLGGTVWSLGLLEVDDPEGLFVPASIMNELRRELVSRIDGERARRKSQKAAAVKEQLEEERSESLVPGPMRVVKIRLGQNVPRGDWDEVVVAIGKSGDVPEFGEDVRLALPVFVKEVDYSRFRSRVKNLVRSGYAKWEAADLAGLRMLKSLGVEDVTADWTLYSFNTQAVRALGELGVKRCVFSPEGDPRDVPIECPMPIERIVQQSTPLFISVTRPAAEDPSRLIDAKGGEFVSFELDGLWVTTRAVPRTFPVSAAGVTRIDLSWDAEVR